MVELAQGGAMSPEGWKADFGFHTELQKHALRQELPLLLGKWTTRGEKEVMEPDRKPLGAVLRSRDLPQKP